MKFSLYSKKNVLDEMQEQTMSGMACGTAIFLPVWEPMRFILCWRPWRLRCYVA